MASVSVEPNGRRTLQFVAPDGKRRSIRLGKVSAKDAERIKGRVEHLVVAANARLPIDTDTAAWVASIGAGLAGKLATAGLIAARAADDAAPRLKAFVDGYIAARTDVKPQTELNLEVCARRLVEHFGADRPLAEITAGHADEFCAWLRTVYAPATAARTVGRAKQLFRAAVRRAFIAANPFEGCKAGHQSNPSRAFFVTREAAEKVIAACPDHEWRLLVALSRYGGLRCPSEHLALTWQDVDWHRGRFLVHSAKLEHHEGGGERWVPIFPELRQHLEEAFERAAPGAAEVITRYRDTRANLRTQLHRIIRRAGLTPWEKCWQNMRSTRQTELAAQYPLHVVCAWIGNKQAVAAEHYLQVTDADFERAGRPAYQSDDAAGAGECSAPCSALQNPVRLGASSAVMGRQDENEAGQQLPSKTEVAAPCHSTQVYLAPRPGLEPGTNRLH